MTAAPLLRTPALCASAPPRPAADAGATGYLHSWESGSVVDGPGMRFVAWLSGCPMRCQYCHNPDTWRRRNGRPVTVDELMAEAGRYARFIRATGGGVTLSGGEPLAQDRFVARVFRACKEAGLHTTLDTNGYLGDRLSDTEVADVDLVLLDIKSFDPETHRRVTGVDVEPVLAFARRLARLGTRVWLRFVLVPGLTDDPANVDGLAAFAAGLGNVERVDVLPFHQMGREKWAQLGMPYALEDTPTPGPALVEAVAERFRAQGLLAR